MSTFGNTSAGDTIGLFYGSGELIGFLVASTQNRTIDSISVSSNRNTADGKIKGVLVLHSNHNIISNGVGSGITLGATKTWHISTFSTPPSVINTTDYDISVISGDDASDQVYIYYDSGQTDDPLYDGSNNYTTPTNPTDGNHTSITNKKFSIYATYTPTTTEVIGPFPTHFKV